MLKCNHVTKRYSNCTALDDVSLTIVPGQTYALLGPNGHGKTTLMKTIAGLISPTSGTVTLDDIPVGTHTKAYVTYMPTEDYFYHYMDCKDIARFYQDFYTDFDVDKYNWLLKDMELAPNIKSKQMSSGMMAKLKLSVALSRNSSITMLDEPLNGVDIIARDKIVDALTNHRAPNASTIISTHLIDELENIVNQAIFIQYGKIVCAGTIQELREQNHMSLVELYKYIYGGVTPNGGFHA